MLTDAVLFIGLVDIFLTVYVSWGAGVGPEVIPTHRLVYHSDSLIAMAFKPGDFPPLVTFLAETAAVVFLLISRRKMGVVEPSGQGPGW